MLAWFLGLIPALVVLTLGRRRIDYRVVLLGAVLPDLIDLPSYPHPRFGHTLALPLGLLLIIQILLRGARARRWFVLPVACLAHLALDGMWSRPLVLFWPAFGTAFGSGGGPLTSHVLLKEVAGGVVLAYMVAAFRLYRPGPAARLLKRGELASNRAGGAEPPGAPAAPDA